MENIKNELIRLGIDPTLIPNEALARLQIACREAGETLFSNLWEGYTAAITEHNALADAVASTAHQVSITILSLAELPAPPKRGFSSACARMLAELSAVKETSVAELISETLSLRTQLNEGRKTRLDLAKERSLLHLANQIRRVDIPIPGEETLATLFGEELESALLRLTALLCEFEAFLVDFALSVARSAKKVDTGEVPPNEYGRLIESARIRLHDLGVATSHIRKETDHVKIHTCP